jgi:hypothetical protein
VVSHNEQGNEPSGSVNWNNYLNARFLVSQEGNTYKFPQLLVKPSVQYVEDLKLCIIYRLTELVDIAVMPRHTSSSDTGVRNIVCMF